MRKKTKSANGGLTWPTTRNVAERSAAVKERQMKEEIHKMFDKSVLPPHLGGTSHSYGPFELSNIEICNETGSCDGLPTVNPLNDEEE